MWGVIIYPCPNFNGGLTKPRWSYAWLSNYPDRNQRNRVEVKAGIINCIPLFYGYAITHPCHNTDGEVTVYEFLLSGETIVI